MSSGEDRALEVLLQVRTAAAPDLSVELLRACYLAQKEFLFADDPAKPLEKMRKLVELEVDTRLAKEQL